MCDTTEQAIHMVLKEKKAYWQFLSADNIEEMNGKRNGIKLPISAINLFFSFQEQRKRGNLNKRGIIRWQNCFITECNFIWHSKKMELWITGFEKDFPFRDPDYTGAILVLVKDEGDSYQGFILNTEDSMEEFMDIVGVCPVETGIIKF